MDMWYVLHSPDSMDMAASALSKGSLSARPPAGFQQNEGETKEGIGNEAVSIAFVGGSFAHLKMKGEGLRVVFVGNGVMAVTRAVSDDP